MCRYHGYYNSCGGYIPIVTILMLFMCYCGKKLTWTQTHACNNKINAFLDIAPPTGTSLSL
jgi:hypothetical protein